MSTVYLQRLSGQVTADARRATPLLLALLVALLLACLSRPIQAQSTPPARVEVGPREDRDAEAKEVSVLGTLPRLGQDLKSDIEALTKLFAVDELKFRPNDVKWRGLGPFQAALLPPRLSMGINEGSSFRYLYDGDVYIAVIVIRLNRSAWCFTDDAFAFALGVKGVPARRPPQVHGPRGPNPERDSSTYRPASGAVVTALFSEQECAWYVQVTSTGNGKATRGRHE